MHARLMYLMSLVLVLSLVSGAQAAWVNWHDSTGDHNWFTPENWDNLAVPTSADKAKIGAVPGPTIANEDAVIADPTAEDTSIVLAAAGEYVFQVEAFDGEYSGSDTVTIHVYNDRCEAARSLPDYVPLVGDLNGDCRVDDVDMALLQENWLEDNSMMEEWFEID